MTREEREELRGLAAPGPMEVTTDGERVAALQRLHELGCATVERDPDDGCAVYEISRLGRLALRVCP